MRNHFLFILISVAGLFGQEVAAQIIRTNFTSTNGFKIIGPAVLTDNLLRLTTANQGEVSSVWFGDRQSITNFEASFQFRISEGANGGGDGFAFVIQDSGLDATGTGPGQGGIGYYGIPRSVALEFDTWYNAERSDPSDNHISIQTLGLEPNSNDQSASLGSVTLPFDLQDGNVHSVRIVYKEDLLALWIDSSSSAPTLQARLHLPSYIGSDTAYVGFTATTGFAYQNQDILNFSYIPSPVAPTLTDTALHIGFQVNGTIGLEYEVQYREDLPNAEWKALGHVTLAHSSEFFVDPTPATLPRRFYRAVLGPTN